MTLATGHNHRRQNGPRTMTHTTCTECLTAERAARARWIDNHIHETRTGRFIIAQHHRGQYIADMNARGRRLTGCSQVFGPTVASAASDPSVTKYASHRGAVRAAAEHIELALAEVQCAACRRRDYDRATVYDHAGISSDEVA